VSNPADDDDDSGPEEYTVYPDGRIHEHRRGRDGRRQRGDGGHHHWGREKGGRYGYGVEEKDGFYYEGGRGRGGRRRRSREETKGVVLAALMVVAGVVLCWD
jgi:hypothetical protein